MKVYLLNRDTRKHYYGDDGTYGTFSTFEKAQTALREKLDNWTDEELNAYKEYGSDFSKGCIYTEEDSWEIIEKEID